MTHPPKQNTRNLIYGFTVAAGFSILCCAGYLVFSFINGGTTAPTAIVLPSPIPIETIIAGTMQAAQMQTANALPLVIATSSTTPIPTQTPFPTETLTALPTFAPILLQGKGDNVVDVFKPSDAAIANIAHNGDGNFAVWNIDGFGNRLDLLVNTIGPYQGTVPIDFLEGEHTARFEITAGGSWKIEILPLSSARRETMPGIFQGTGDTIVILEGGIPDLLKATSSSGHGNFAIWEYGEKRNLLINEISPYTGTVAMSNDTVLIVITATGQWVIEISTH